MPKAPPWIWIVAGINGAGKSTLCGRPEIRTLLKVTEILNPDIRTRALLAEHTELEVPEANLQAARMTDAEVLDRLRHTRASFGVETVLSSDKFETVLGVAREQAWRVGLIYFALPTVEVAIERVKLRVLTGGHHVAEHKVRGRWGRSIGNLKRFLPVVDVGYVMGNPTEQGAVVLGRAREGRISIDAPDGIPWVVALLREMGTQE